jgi:hypothetical protein
MNVSALDPPNIVSLPESPWINSLLVCEQFTLY